MMDHISMFLTGTAAILALMGMLGFSILLASLIIHSLIPLTVISPKSMFALAVSTFRRGWVAIKRAALAGLLFVKVK